MTLIHQCRALPIPQATEAPTDEVCGRIGNTRHLEVIPHTCVDPLCDRGVIGADHFHRHVLTRVGAIGQGCLTGKSLHIVVRERRESAVHDGHQEGRHSHTHGEVTAAHGDGQIRLPTRSTLSLHGTQQHGVLDLVRQGTGIEVLVHKGA